MKEYQQRVITEKQELDAKIEALGTFINTSPIFGTLPSAEKERLEAQWEVMQEYSAILGERIENF